MSEYQRPEPRILVVDDDASIRRLVTTIVRRERLTVDCAVDGAEAIELLKKHEYSVILLDLMMPRVDGFGVVNFIKQHPPHDKPIVLVITAYADQSFKEVDSSVVSGVLRKPVEVAELGEIVRLCVSGFHNELSQRLYVSSDRAIRDFARRDERRGRDDS
jgi:two-component system response regulator PilR (NtrC family)